MVVVGVGRGRVGVVVAGQVVVHGQRVERAERDLQRGLRHLRQGEGRHAGRRGRLGGRQLAHPQPHPQLGSGSQGRVVQRLRGLRLLLLQGPQPPPPPPPPPVPFLAAVRVVGLDRLVGGGVPSPGLLLLLVVLLLEVHD